VTTYSFAAATKECSPVGVWYGGSDFKYMLTIIPPNTHVNHIVGKGTPATEDTFLIRYEAVYPNAAWGYEAWTSWSGQLVRNKDGRRYLGQSISRYTTSPEAQPPSGSFELDAVRNWNEFVNCDTIRSTIDFFGAYFDLNRVPFVDAPDLNYLPPEGKIIETCHRMPTKCPACSTSIASSASVQRKR
jgi:hypothetical protein